MRHFYSLLAVLPLAVALTAPIQAAFNKISDLPAITSPSTNTWIEVADMAAATKSRKYLLTNLATVAQVPTLPTNMVVSTGASTAGAVATYTGTDGTNTAPSLVIISSSTNLSTAGSVTAIKGFQQGQGTITHAGTVTLNFDDSTTANSLSVTGNLVLATSNLATNRIYKLRTVGCSTNSAITAPSWIWQGPTPSQITANKQGYLELEAWGGNDTNVLAWFTEQP